MSDNRRFLKAFGLIDGHGRLIPGQVILRKKKPPRGRWIELDTYECCDGILHSVTVGTLPFTTVGVTITCSVGSKSITLVLSGGATANTDLVETLNDQAGYLGVWSISGGNVVLLMKQSVSDEFGCTGTTTVSVHNVT